MTHTIRIGGASAGFIDSAIAVPQLLAAGVDFLAFDFMGEGNMPILARRTHDGTGTPYMSEFIDQMSRYLSSILDGGVRVVANAGGLDAAACAAALREVAASNGLRPKIAFVEGDNIASSLPDFRRQGLLLPFGREGLPEKPCTTANAYFGALPIAAALDRGADIVITGRIVDSAASLGPLIHAFGWSADDWDRLSAGTLIGHLLECGAHVTGGLFTDWQDVPGWDNIGYPIAECRADGSAIITKPAGTGGLVSVGTVAEQMLYEVGDPARYMVPDVVCDFTGVQLTQLGPDRVEVSGARGGPAPDTYKAILTHEDGWRGTATVPVSGEDAVAKAERIGAALITRTNAMLRQRNLPEWRATQIEAIGGEASYGAQGAPSARAVREVVLRLVGDHEEAAGAALLVSEHFSAGISMAPGNACSPLGVGVTQLFRLQSVLIPKTAVPIFLEDDAGRIEFMAPPGTPPASTQSLEPGKPAPAGALAEGAPSDATVGVLDLAWVRSGDKGDISNVAVIARRPEFLPFLRAALSPEAVGRWYAHLAPEGGNLSVNRFEVPGIHALNFMLHGTLDGGMTISRRYDPMGKGIAQQLLRFPVPVASAVLDRAR